MIRIGLTGSIGMGKSTAAKMLEGFGARVWDADAAVHRLYETGGGAVEPLREVFPDAVIDDTVDRGRLAALVLNDREAIKKLEAIVHPLVGADRELFMAEAAMNKAEAVVLDIPLLFENGSESLFDAVIVVSAPLEVQRARVLERPGMTEEKFNAIVSQQMPDWEKRAKADFVISTDQSKSAMRADLKKAYDQILSTARGSIH